jgi:hypothetical protein
VASLLDLNFRAIRQGFFDARKVAGEVEKAGRKLQSKFGAYTRRRMQTSIRYGKGTAAPGKPPVAHRASNFSRVKKNKAGASGKQAVSPLRELIFFALDQAAGSVVIGPLAFGARGARALEEGGTIAVRDRKTGGVKRRRISPHPFARPAGEAEAQKLPELLKRMVN